MLCDFGEHERPSGVALLGGLGLQPSLKRVEGSACTSHLPW